jgi:hypothetical protein
MSTRPKHRLDTIRSHDPLASGLCCLFVQALSRFAGGMLRLHGGERATYVSDRDLAAYHDIPEAPPQPIG